MKGLPEPPPWLGHDASRVWSELIARSPCCDHPETLATYCVAWTAWQRVRRLTADETPATAIGRDLSKSLMALEMELGQQVAELAEALGLEAPGPLRRRTRVLVLDEGEDGENDEV